MNNRITIAIVVALFVKAALAADAGSSSSNGAADAKSRAAIAALIADSQERFWTGIATAEPAPTASTRTFFTYALTLCEARRRPERLERLFRLAISAQDRNQANPHYGNFKWSWRDPGVTDGNSVDFCMHDALRIWLQHRDWLPAAAREALADAMRVGIEGELRHSVLTSYTNITLLNSANLIGLGEAFDRPDAAAEGYRRFEAFYLYTSQLGIHEYCSPTYYIPDLSGLEFIEANAASGRAREQARAVLRLFWTDITLNWFQPSDKCGGAQSRSYDYLYGLGGIDTQLWLQGWLGGELPSTAHILTTLPPCWTPPASLWESATRDLPRLVRQRFGPRNNEFRTAWTRPDICLSVASIGYGSQDMPLTIDLPGPRSAPRSYFIADGREDPYGKIKYETSSARHMKALHLKPFWAAAQRDGDALALAVYREPDLAEPEVKNVQSHLVLRRSVDGGFWLNDKKLPIGPKRNKANVKQPARIAIEPGAALVIRHGAAAFGVRVLWSRRQDGQPARVELVDDGNDYGVVRLTIEHAAKSRTAEAGAAFWIRAAGGLSDDAFQAWRRRFAEAKPMRVEASATGVRIEVPADGPVDMTVAAKDAEVSTSAARGAVVSLSADAPFGPGRVDIDPRPLGGVFEVDGREIGRPLFAEPAPIGAGPVNFEHSLVVPTDSSVTWDAEDGLVFSHMTIADDAQARNGRYVWQPPAPQALWKRTGEIFWPLDVAKAGRYYLWARTEAPTSETDSFLVELLDGGAALDKQVAWSVPHSDTWRWNPVMLAKGRGPTPLDLPAGRSCLRFAMREAGAKVDAFFLTPTADERPAER